MTITGRQNRVVDRENTVQTNQDPRTGTYLSAIDPLRADYDAVWVNGRGAQQGYRRLKWAGNNDDRNKLISQGGSRKVEVLFSRYTSMMSPEDLGAALMEDSEVLLSPYTERIRYSRIGDQSWASELSTHGGGGAAPDGPH